MVKDLLQGIDFILSGSWLDDFYTQSSCLMLELKDMRVGLQKGWMGVKWGKQRQAGTHKTGLKPRRRA